MAAKWGMNRLRSAELESPAVKTFFAQIVFRAFRGVLTILRPWVSQYATDEGGPRPRHADAPVCLGESGGRDGRSHSTVAR